MLLFDQTTVDGFKRELESTPLLGFVMFCVFLFIFTYFGALVIAGLPDLLSHLTSFVLIM